MQKHRQGLETTRQDVLRAVCPLLEFLDPNSGLDPRNYVSSLRKLLDIAHCSFFGHCGSSCKKLDTHAEADLYLICMQFVTKHF